MTHFQEIEAFISLQSDLSPRQRAKARQSCIKALHGQPLDTAGLPDDICQTLRRLVNEAAYKARVAGQVYNPRKEGNPYPESGTAKPGMFKTQTIRL